MPAKPKKRQRRTRGSGSVQQVGEKFRARKQKLGHPPALGSLRDTWDEAYADLPGLTFENEEEPDVPTFQDFVESELTGRRAQGIAHGTWERDELIWRTRLHGSDLGRKRLDLITEDDVQAFIDDQTHAMKFVFERDESGKVPVEMVDGRKQFKGKAEKSNRPLEHSSIKRIGACLSAYFEIARSKRYRYIKSNPAHDVEYPAPKRQAPHKKSLTPEQAAAFPALANLSKAFVTQGPLISAMLMVARDTGLRRGEICGLKRDALFQAMDGHWALLIDRAIAIGPKGYEESSTKTNRIRTVPITDETANLLLSQPKVNEYFFNTGAGKRVRPDYFTRSFKRFAIEAGLPNLHLHNLRHTHISLMLRAGVDIKTIQGLVGHSTPKMILEVYGETFDDSMRDAADKMGKLLKAESEKAGKKSA